MSNTDTNDSTELTDEEKAALEERRRQNDLAKFTAHVYIDTPGETWEIASARADPSDEADMLGQLFEHMRTEYAFLVGDRVAYQSDGFDPEQAVVPAAPDGEVLANVRADVQLGADEDTDGDG